MSSLLVFLFWGRLLERKKAEEETCDRPRSPGDTLSFTLFSFLFHLDSTFFSALQQGNLDEEAAAAEMDVTTLPNGDKGSEPQDAAALLNTSAAAFPSPAAAHHHRDHKHANDPHLHALSRLCASAARRRLQRAWRSFHGVRSAELARAFVATGVLGGRKSDDDEPGAAAAPSPPPPAAVLGVGSPGSSAPPPLAHRASADGILASDFDGLAEILMLPATLRAARALLARCEARLSLRPHEAHTGVSSSHGKLVASFARTRKSGNGDRESASGSSSPVKPSPSLPLPLLPGGRYPLRVFLSSLMMVAHPEVVFRSANGEKEKALRAAAAKLKRALCVLLAAMISGKTSTSSPSSNPSSSKQPLPRALSEALSPSAALPETIPPPSKALSTFDAAWAEFLASFVAWKAADAAALEADLVRAAVELEGSRLAIEAGTLAAAAECADSPSPRPPPESPPEASRQRPRRAASGADAAEVAAGVSRDLGLLRSKALELGGEGAARRLDAALEGCRARAASEALLSSPERSSKRRGRGGAAEAAADATASAAPAAAVPPPPGGDLLPSTRPPSGHPFSSYSILNLPSIARAPSGTLPAPSKTESVLWGLIKSGGEPVGMLRLAEAIWGDAASPSSSSSFVSVADVERVAAESEIAAEAAAAAASAEIATSGVDSPGSSATDAAVASARAADEARWARARLAFAKGVGTGECAALVAASALSTAARRVAGALGAGARASEAAHSLRREYEMIRLRDEFSISSSSSSSSSIIPGLDVEKVLTRLEALSDTLRSLCAPSRDAGHAAAAAASRAAVGAAFALAAASSGSEDATAAAAPRIALATALASSLRRADAGARLLQADVAATEARALAAGGAAAGGVGGSFSSSASSNSSGTNPLAARARSLLRLRAALPASATEEELSAALPLTRAWLAEACGRLPVIEGGLPPPPTSPSAEGGERGQKGATAAAPAAGLPANLVLRSGFSATSSSSSALPSRARARHELVLPAPCGGWRAAFRTGLLSLVAAPTPLAPSAAAAAAAAAQGPPGGPFPTAVPEVVALELAELLSAQHEFQLIAVCAAGAMLVRNSSSAATPAEVRARLRALLADSATSATLPDLAAELALLASSPSPSSKSSSSSAAATAASGGKPLSPPPPRAPSLESLEKEMRAGLGRLLRRGSPPFEALSGALETALAARLLCAPGAASDNAAAAALARAGAGALAGDVDALSERVAGVASVSESVFGPLVEHVVEGLL